MATAIESDQASCVRLTWGTGEGALVAAVLYDDGHEQAGSAAFLVRDCTRAAAYGLLAQVESLVGFVAVLLSACGRSPREAVQRQQGLPIPHAGEPSRVLLEMAAEIGNRHGLDQVAIGIVHGRRVRVALMNGEAEPRAANPGARLLSEAMGECLDRGSAVLVAGDPGLGEFRLHAAWLHSRGGGAVGSLPVVADDETLAIVSVACADPAALSAEKLAAMGRDLAAHAPVLRVARLAARSLAEHAREALAGGWRKWRRARWRRLTMVSAAVAVLAWGALGTLPYSLTVPCVVKAAGRRSVSAPRDGILAEIFVRPGDSVRTGQLLAEFDSQDDQLARAELECEQTALAAQIDRALADHDAGLLRVLEAQRMGVLARLDVCEQRIEQARIRAPQDGVVLTGDLRERVGSRMAMGDELYELARSDGALVALRIPEQVVLAARETSTASFVASADPGTAHVLSDLRIAPASIVADGHNTFLAEAGTDASLWRLSPGMEGFAMLDVGQRPVWWVLSHRALSWLQLNFWI
jgi:multidrug efflux pump subunit AcrA (membrane-fusion protein)